MAQASAVTHENTKPSRWTRAGGLEGWIRGVESSREWIGSNSNQPKQPTQLEFLRSLPFQPRVFVLCVEKVWAIRNGGAVYSGVFAMSKLFAPHNSLVRYDAPILVSTTKDPRNKSNLDEGNNLTPTEDILNSILPPREWTEEGQLWVQYVSSTPSTRADVIALQEQLDSKLGERQARETGICPIREELYAQCFDELIRQITINCAERGLLLLRVRDEIRMTIACYQTLYESSIAFGMRTALQSEQGKVEMQGNIKILESEVRDLEKQVDEMQNKCTALEAREAKRRTEENTRHEEEMDTLRKHNLQLKRDLEQLLAVPDEN
jgi:dynein light intermediate chain